MISVIPPRADARGARKSPLAERLLQGIGADSQFVEAVLGDLAEEFASRAERDGSWLARLWYVREAVRSSPHLFASGLRRVGRGQRTRMAACLVAGVVTSLAVVLGRQARAVTTLEADSGPGGVVVNSMRPVRLPVRVLDAAGRILKSTNVQFRWLSGAAVAISPSGATTCAQAGDARVRASLGALSTDLIVHCRPVRDVYGPAMLDLVAGDSARDVPFEAIGADGRPVTLLAGQFTVRDSTVATLKGQRIHARKQGSTWVRARFGERASFTSVHVYERVPSPESIRPDQHLAVSVLLAPGEMRQWRLPAGEYFLRMLPEHPERPRPLLAVTDADCKSALGHLTCFARHPATVFAFYPRGADHVGALNGTLVVWRLENP